MNSGIFVEKKKKQKRVENGSPLPHRKGGTQPATTGLLPGIGFCLLHCSRSHYTACIWDVPPKGLRKQGKAAKKPSTSEDFWITSTHDMDNSAVQSQGSISSASITNQAADPHGGSCNPTEFVNHGLILWNQTRQGWIGNKRSKNQTEQLREPKLSWNATYESLLGSNKPFPQHIPLAEMVDFLVDIWEQEGLYD
ncbi:hypothetical protein GmHk_15G042479 [Glycine max]|nr:hypothetical protein GmHk_15G042479 [Glycine max]